MMKNKKSKEGIRKFDWHDFKKPPAYPREEVIRVIERKGDCRIPMTFEPIEIWFRNESLYGFFEKWPNDIIFANIGLEPRRFDQAVEEDGMVLHGSSAVNHLIKDWSQADAVCDRLMPPLTREWVESVRDRIAETPGHYHAAAHISLLFEFCFVLRGMQQFFIDLYESRDKVERLLDRILEYTCEMMKGYSKAGMDAVFIGEDLGSQQSLMINPRLWREMFKPRYEVWVKTCHDAGLHAWFHSDGNLDSIFPELVETGIDVYNPLQPGAINVEKWRNRYKGKLTFYTGIDVQGMLPFASPGRVKDEIRKSIEKFSSDEGGFILGPTNAITAEVPYENLVALYEVLMENR